MNAVEKIEPQGAITTLPAPSETAAVLHMIERAARDPSVDMDKMLKLMDMRDKAEVKQARKAFDEAVAAAKAQIPPITRNATGHNNKKYADFAAISGAIDPVLGRHGLSYRFETNQSDKAITVTCILFGHGHSIPAATLTAPADMTGNKNAIQAIGSTLTYLQRYSLVQALGLAATHDDDGRAAGVGVVIDEEQLKQIIALADDVGADKEKFCAVMKVPSLADIRANEFQRAVDLLNSKRKAAAK